MNTPIPSETDSGYVADVFVIFGATGDLARKKLHPALYRLSAQGRLTVPVVGVARSSWSDEQLRTLAREAVRARYGAVPDPELAAFAERKGVATVGREVDESGEQPGPSSFGKRDASTCVDDSTSCHPL